MRVDYNWSFKDLIMNIKRLKEEYVFYLALFSSTDNIEDKKLCNLYIKTIRDTFYDFNLKEWQIDLCWEYMNDYIVYPDLIYHLNRLDKKNKK